MYHVRQSGFHPHVRSSLFPFTPPSGKHFLPCILRLLIKIITLSTGAAKQTADGNERTNEMRVRGGGDRGRLDGVERFCFLFNYL